MTTLSYLLLASSIIAIADPDWARAGTAGLIAYVVVSLATVWIEARANAGHRDDCHDRLRDIQARLGRLESPAAKRHGRTPE